MTKKLAVLLVVLAAVVVAQFGGGNVGLPPGTMVAIANVINLPAELASRPLKSGTFTVSRAAFINSSGLIESVSGASTDCVKVNGTSGSCSGGGVSGTQVIDEQPSGSGLAYTIANAPIAGSVEVRVNGLPVFATTDYTLSGATITFVGGYSWLSGASQVRVSYRY